MGHAKVTGKCLESKRVCLYNNSGVWWRDKVRQPSLLETLWLSLRSGVTVSRASKQFPVGE